LRFLFFFPPDWGGWSLVFFFGGYLPFSFGMACTGGAPATGFPQYSTALNAAVSLLRGGQDSIPGGCEVLGLKGCGHSISLAEVCRIKITNGLYPLHCE